MGCFITQHEQGLRAGGQDVTPVPVKIYSFFLRGFENLEWETPDWRVVNLRSDAAQRMERSLRYYLRRGDLLEKYVTKVSAHLAARASKQLRIHLSVETR